MSKSDELDELDDLDDIEKGRVKQSLLAAVSPFLNLAMLALLGIVAWFTWQTRRDIEAQRFQIELTQHNFEQQTEQRSINQQKRRNERRLEELADRRARMAAGERIPAATAVTMASGYLSGDKSLGLRDLANLQAFREGAPAVAGAPVGFAPLVEGLLRLEQFESEDFPSLDPAAQGRLYGLVSVAQSQPNQPPPPSIENLVMARRAFERVLADGNAGSLQLYASAGLARANLIVAQAANFTPEACAPLVENPPPPGATPTKYLLSRAACLRKLGRTADAFRDFDRALTQVNAAPAADKSTREWADLAFQAEHGRATTLIPLRTEMSQEERLDAAEAGLERAADLREQAGQTYIERTYTLENIGFILLRRGDYNGAISHAKEMDETTPFLSWTLLIWSLAADELGQHDAASVDAHRRLRFFDRAGFNECELRRLLPEKFIPQMNALLETTIQDANAEPVVCPETQRSDYAGRG